MKIIGITGKSGSGKTTLALQLTQVLNGQYINIDKIGHEALYQSKNFNILCERFGKEILDENGQIDRKKVGNIVFADKQKMEILTEITWEYMQKVIDKILMQNDNIVILDWVLLPNSKYWDKSDFKILVKSDDIERKQKIIERDKISEDYFDKRDSASMDYSIFKFDYIFENDYQMENINEMVQKIEKQINKKA